jgi:gliding motility-associated-like protein
MCEQYLWNTGEKTSNIVVNKPGIYSVQCILKGCTIWDSTMIEGCDFKLNFPNAFTPNGDGLNDAFSPKGVLVYDFNLRIFNKWGTQIFYSNDINQGWNGDGMPCDVYFYICEFKDFLGINYAKSGNFTLLR